MNPTHSAAPKALEKRLKQQSRQERKSIVERNAKTCVGASTWRALADNTKQDVVPALEGVSIKKLTACRDEADFKSYFRRELKRVDRALSKKNPSLKGRQWGYGAKILCLFLRGLVLHTRYYDDKTMQRLKRLLYVPVDRIVLKELRKIGLDPGCRAINTMTEESFWKIQNWLMDAANSTKVPAIIFDDVWSDRD